MRADTGDELVIKGHHVGDADRKAVIMEVHGEDGAAPAENYVRAGQAARWYSWMTPPKRSRRRMFSRAISPGSLIGSGTGRSGAA